MRWRDVGLDKAPGDDFLDRNVPFNGRLARVHGQLVFDGGRLVAVAVDGGFTDDNDRTRLLEMALVEEGADAGVAARALVDFTLTNVYAVRVRSGGLVARSLGGGQELGDYVHYARQGATADKAEAPIDDATLAKHAAVAVPPVVTAPIVMLDPSRAHTDMIESGKALAPFFFPRSGDVHEVDVAIVGAGIAGLTTAYALKGRSCVIFERESILGGTARAATGAASRFPLGAHYECDPIPSYGPELLALYESLEVVRRDALGRYTFIDAQYYVPPEDYEQSVLANGSTRRRGWRMFFDDPAGIRARETLVKAPGTFTLPTRLTDDATRALQTMTLAQWLREHDLTLPPDLQHGLDVLLRSDYATPTATTSAFAGLHYFLCRPYLRGGSRTFSPPEGLSYFAERLFQRTQSADLRTRHMVRRLEPRHDGVHLDVLDLETRKLRRFRARAVVYASPKKAVKYLNPADASLFAINEYAPWLTVTMEMQRFAESAQLCWNNHVYDERREHIGFSWINHHDKDAPPVLTHYIAFEPGRWQHMRALFANPRELVSRCVSHVSAIVGRDISRSVEKVTVQKLGHAMAAPLVGKLFYDPNARRAHERVVYAGVDTGRLPLIADAFDSGLEAAKLVRALG